MVIFFLWILAGYLVWLLAMWVGWERIRRPISIPAKHTRFITIIVPFRNEGKRMEVLLRSLAFIRYPKDKFEVILVSDHSTHQFDDFVCKAIDTMDYARLIRLGDNEQGKKAALTKGVSRAKGMIIASTDADSMIPPGWLLRINEIFYSPNVKMLFGGVCLKQDHTLFSAVQSMEFSSLIGSGAASLSWGFFTLCSGANMAFLKSVFEQVDGYAGNMDIPSGDDVFLAEKILKLHPKSIRFCSAKDAVVIAQPQRSLKSFINQRLRWGGKWRYSRLRGLKWSALFVFVTHVIVLFLMISLTGGGIDHTMIYVLLGFKALLEGMFLFSIGRFLGLKWSWFSFFILQLTYSLYVVGIGFLAQRGYYHWKGRKLSHKTIAC